MDKIICNTTLNMRKELGKESPDTKTGLITTSCHEMEECREQIGICMQDVKEVGDYELNIRRNKETLSDADIKTMQRESDVFFHNIENVLLHGKDKRYRESALSVLRGILDGSIDKLLNK